MYNKILIFALIVLLLFDSYETKIRDKRESQGLVRGCYYTNWAQYRPDKGKFIPDYYSPGLCTHIFFAFAVMNDNYTMKAYEWNDLSQGGLKGMYERINSWKRNQADLKTLLSFAGSTFSTKSKKLIQTMSSTKQNRKIFIKSAMDFVRKYNFDGLDIDWDFPDAEDKRNFADLLTELSSKFHEKGLLVTVAVSASIFIIDSIYDVQVLNAMDMVNIMTYDFHGSWEPVTGFNSPLFDNRGDQLSVSNATEYWIRQGLSKKVINIGFPAYGRGWTLTDPSKNGILASGTGASKPGKYTNEAGYLAYYEICNMVNNGGQRYFDNDQKVPYVVFGNQWFGYDDEESFKLKLKWLKQNGYGGAFLWSMDLDDFNGICKPGLRFPLLNVFKKELS